MKCLYPVIPSISSPSLYQKLFALLCRNAIKHLIKRKEKQFQRCYMCKRLYLTLDIDARQRLLYLSSMYYLFQLYEHAICKEERTNDFWEDFSAQLKRLVATCWAPYLTLEYFQNRDLNVIFAMVTICVVLESILRGRIEHVPQPSET